MVKYRAFNVVVVASFPDISQFSIDSPLSEAYLPSKHGCPLPNTCWVIEFQASTVFPKVVYLLRQHHLLVVTNSCPRAFWHPRAWPTAQFPYSSHLSPHITFINIKKTTTYFSVLSINFKICSIVSKKTFSKKIISVFNENIDQFWVLK